MIKNKHLENIFRGKFSLKDQKKAEAYFQNPDLDEEVKNALEEQWTSFEEDKSQEINLDHVFYKLFFEIKQQEGKRSKLAPIMRYCAVFLVGAFLAGGVYFWNANFSSSAPIASIEFFSPEGMRSKFKLPDGTEGWLGHHSSLHYKLNKSKEREVSVDGQAYFDVFPDTEKPFVVSSPLGYKVCVKGTRFNLNSYSVENNFELVLEEGSVVVKNEKELIDKLSPNEKLSYDNSTGQFSKSIVIPTDFTAWKDGQLILNYEPFEQSCKKIGHFYNVEFLNIPEELKSETVRLILRDESLEEALYIMTLLYPVKYEVIDRERLTDNSYSKRKINLKMN